MSRPRYSIRSVVTLRQRRVTVLLSKMFDVESFIEAVKVRQALYDHNHKNYNRKDVRSRLWDEIGHIMYPQWRALDPRDRSDKVTVMQKKWKSLKDCFNREIRQQKTRDQKKFHKRYEFYERLSFLLQKNVATQSKPTGPVKEKKMKQENTDAEARVTQLFEASFPQLVSSQTQEVIPVSDESLKKRKRIEEEELLFQPKQPKKTEETENSDRLFLMSFVSDLSRLPLATKYWVKMKFSEIMHQAAMSLDGYQDAEYASTTLEFEQDIGSPLNGFVAEYSEDSPADPSSSEIYDVSQD